MVRHFVLGLFVVSLLGSNAMAEDTLAANGITQLHPEGDYLQKATGMVFPVSVGDFQRIDVSQYAADGTDESAAYVRAVPMQEVVATVYVFPSPNTDVMSWPKDQIAETRAKLCDSYFSDVENGVTDATHDAVLLGEEKVTLTQGGITYAGHKATYRQTSPQFLNRTNVVANSEAYLYCYVGGKWTVEYRIDYPADYKAGGVIAAFMRDLHWTIPPETK